MKSLYVAFLAFAILIASGISHAALWTFENVEYHPFSPFWEYDSSIAVTSDGAPRIAYSESDVNRILIYATKNQTGWIKENVDTGDDGYYPSLILDSSGRPHISYSIHDNLNIKHGLKYAFKDGGNWNTEFANSIDRIDYSSLGLCASGPCMSYTYVANSSLQYSFKQGGGWQRSGLSRSPDYYEQGPFSSLAVDRDDVSHIVYLEDNTDELWHTKGKGLNWSDYECVDPDGWIGESTSCLKCDSSGRLHLSYLRIVQEGDFISYSLYYACRDNSG
jgi:hypothetical protein